MGLGWLAGAGAASRGARSRLKGQVCPPEGKHGGPRDGKAHPDAGARDPAVTSPQCRLQSEVTVSVRGQKAVGTPKLLLRVGIPELGGARGTARSSETPGLLEQKTQWVGSKGGRTLVSDVRGY